MGIMVAVLVIISVTMGGVTVTGFTQTADQALKGSWMFQSENNEQKDIKEKFEVIAEFPPDIYKVDPEEIRMSSVSSDHTSGSCMDGITDRLDNFCQTYDSSQDSFPWIALRIPRSLVHGLKVYNRNGGDQFAERTKNLEVRVSFQCPRQLRLNSRMEDCWDLSL